MASDSHAAPAIGPLKSARDARFLQVLIVAGAVLLALAALREYMSPSGGYIAAPDYQAEALPALHALKTDGISGYVHHLPGYPAIMMVQLIPAEIANWLGFSETTTWRFLSIVGIASVALAIMALMPLVRASGASRSSAITAILLAVASPAAYWALRIGHPEEVLASGLLLGAVAAAARERPIIAGVLLGLAVGKAWPAVAALPVLALLLPSARRTITGAAAAAVSIAVIYLPSFLFASTAVGVLSNLGQKGIFNVGQVWWWFGTPLPRSVVMDPAQQVVPQPRGLGPSWPGSISHPLILGIGVAIGLVWMWTLAQRMSGDSKASGAVARLRSTLRTDGSTRSREDAARLAGGALLVMAGILYARCFLDTWNVPYYLLPGLVCGALGEVLLGRPPIITLIATGIMWKWHQPGDATVRSAPDIYTALYLAWTIPFCVAFLRLGFTAIRSVGLAGPKPESPEPEPALPPTTGPGRGGLAPVA